MPRYAGPQIRRESRPAERIRALFAAARKHERAIIFIDEVDAVARRRGGEGEITHVESETTLVPNPDRRGREQILAVHTAGKPIADGVDFTALARRTPGFSGAQLRALVNEACVDAVRRDLVEVTPECFEHAVATIAMGRARTSALVTDHDREVTAWHESGHTLAAYLQEQADDPVQVTIIPRGPAGGVTWMSGNDDQFLPRRKAHAQLVTALAGRAAEEILLDGEFTQGAAGDLQPATKLLGEHKAFLSAVATELLAEDTLTLADVHQIAPRLGVTRHAHVPSPQLPGQIRAAKPVVCMEVPSLVGAGDGETVGAADPVEAGRRSATPAAPRSPLAMVSAPLHRRRSTDDEQVIAES